MTRDLLDCGAWKVFQSEEVLDFHPLFNLQAHIDRRFIGTKIIGSGNIEDILAACHGPKPWNGYADPEYLDKLLIAPDRKSGGVIYQ